MAKQLLADVFLLVCDTMPKVEGICLTLI